MTSSNPQDRLNAALQAAQLNFEERGGTKDRKRLRDRLRRQWTRQIIKTDRLDLIEWTGNQDEQHAFYTTTTTIGIRADAEVDAAINDLFYGDLNKQDDRPGYLNGPELLQDIFFAFYQPIPKLHKKSEVIKDARLNGKFVEQLMGLPAFEEIRDYSITDPETAKGAMLALVDVIKEMIKQHREAVEQANEEREESGTDPNGQPGNSDKENWDEETPGKKSKSDSKSDSKGGGQSSKSEKDGESQLKDDDDSDDDGEPQENWDHHELDDENNGSEGDGDSQDGADQGDDAGDSGDAGDSDDENELIDDVDREFNEELDGEYDHESDWEKLVEKVDFGRAANSTLKEFADDQEAIRQAASGIGITPEEWKMMDPSRRMAIAKRLNTPRMKRIADLFGRMKRFALARQAQKATDQPHEIYTIETGNDLSRVLRQEFALLGTPQTKIVFYYKFVNRELLQYRKRGQEKLGKGPLVICVDNSYSMNGNPEDWAKAVTEALRRIAADQGRDCHVIFFETNSHRERFDFPMGKGPYDKVMAMMSISAGGGTDFDGVLTEALQKAVDFHKATPSHGKSDIVFITDGEAKLNQSWIDDFNAKRKEAGVRVFSIYISAHDSEKSQAMRLLESFSDTAIPVKALEIDDRTTSELFVTI